MPKRGLPESVRMRHDEHYVEALAASAGAPVGRLVPIEQIDPNPTQPRQMMGDLSELIASIGDDALQKQSQGYVVPDSFTHGTSAQRMKWFNAGYTGGDVASCDTFSAQVL